MIPILYTIILVTVASDIADTNSLSVPVSLCIFTIAFSSGRTELLGRCC